MSNKTYTAAGTDVYNGRTRLIFTNDAEKRAKQLAKYGCEEITLIELATPMTKADACALMLEHEDFQGAAEQSAITSYVVKNAKDLAKELGLVEDKPAVDRQRERERRRTGRKGGETVESVEEFDPS